MADNLRKRGLPLAIFFFLFPIFLVSAGEEKIKISKVRIIIDGKNWEWTEKGMVGEEGEDANSRLSPWTVASYLGFKPEASIKPSQLLQKSRAAEIRLEESGLTYSAEVHVLPVRKNPNERVVLVELVSGFFWRFCGGNAWAGVGRAALGGGRNLLLDNPVFAYFTFSYGLNLAGAGRFSFVATGGF